MIKGPMPEYGDQFCCVCVMTIKGTAQRKAAFKDDLNILEIPNSAITVAMTIIGIIGPTCWQHVATHDQEEFDKRKKAILTTQREQRWGTKLAN